MSAGEEMAKKLRARFAAAMAVPQTDMSTKLLGAAARADDGALPTPPMQFPVQGVGNNAMPWRGLPAPTVPAYQPPQGAANPAMPWRGLPQPNAPQLPSPPPGMPMGGPSGPPAPSGNAPGNLAAPPPMPPTAQIGAPPLSSMLGSAMAPGTNNATADYRTLQQGQSNGYMDASGNWHSFATDVGA